MVVCDLGALPSGGDARVDLIIRATDDEGLYAAAEVSAAEHNPELSSNFASAHTVLDPGPQGIYLPLVLRQTPS